MKTASLFSLIAALILLSCNNPPQSGVHNVKPGKNEMAELNAWLVQKDRERIQSYAERKDLDMNESPSGLWYKITREGRGEFISENNKVVFEYRCSLLDGTLCYSSDKQGPKEIVLGRSDLEPGLYEGLRMLKSGGEGIFILPPFLAYGIAGDDKAIPPRAILVYEVKISEIK